MKLEDINKLEISERIKELKKYPAKRPDTQELMKDWDYSKHDVFDETLRKKRRVLIEEPEKSADGTIIKPARYEWQEVNRIALPLEQDIVNIHTAFAVGTEPTLSIESEGEEEQNLLTILKNIFKQNKIKYENKRLVRSWLSECEVAEYWFTTENASWWRKLLKHIGFSNTPTRKLKSVIWSPFRGDVFYPYYDEYGDMIAFSREYKSKDKQGNDVTKLMVIDKQNVTTYANDELESQFKHGFEKIPVMYMSREKPLCDKIRSKRNRLEHLLSNFADCLDYNFYPKLVATGDLEGVQNRGTSSEIIQLSDGGSVAYLTWQQSPDMARLEFDNLINYCYSVTNTPRISFESLRGTGNALSGTAFRYVFMGIHLEVSNHAEVIEEFLQRRVNFLISAIGTLYPAMKSVAETISVDTEIVPYMIDSQSERISDAVNAVSGGIASLETGIVMAGLTDRVIEEKKNIENQKQEKLFSE
ncbi:hypothetical protein CAPN010_16800 [Capnocytophaga cynodegmi]|uniref:phage portal protein n=1 Tax=Capnocytophaga cynodegmi TaxID=28189 RepID=UPI001EE3049A|nr:phage portal protein [Capnocytophaga cynodegmi]GJQ07522.1 hypothetical protein CAPN010_16800 [Capnocytophaga cynodegmi]